MKRYFLIFTLILFSCSEGSDDSSNTGNGGSDNQTVNLFFSEYSEGMQGFNNKYVEIYNPSSSSVNLSNYQIKGTNNGTDWGDNGERELALTGAIEANSVYIICNDAADQAILDKANLALPYESPVHFNGNDAIAIFGIDGSGNFSIIMDVIGNSTDPGTGNGWSVAGTENATMDHTLVRKSSISKGNTNWENSAGTSASNSEWEVKDHNDWTSLGTR